MVLNMIWIVTTGVVGFLMGRLFMYRQMDVELAGAAEETQPIQPSQHTQPVQQTQPVQHTQPTQARKQHGKRHRQEQTWEGWSVGSPVSGMVTEHSEGDHPTVVIHSDGNRLYAPAGGKITRLFPMGNAMIFTTEFGAELYIEAGKSEDELLNRYYRPKIVQNEVVGKGKLLLEFDRQGLEAEGVPADISVSVEHCGFGGTVRMTAGDRVKTGEEILQVQERAAYDA